MAGFAWTTEREQAVTLLAQANLTRREVAEKVGVVQRTIELWLANPVFRERLAAEITKIGDEVRRIGIATITNRVKAQNDRWLRLQRVFEARADDPTMKDVPGGTTGLIVRQIKGIGRGEDFQTVEIFEVDTGSLKALLELEKQAAQELGQWVTKIETPPPDDSGIEPAVAARALAATKPPDEDAP